MYYWWAQREILTFILGYFTEKREDLFRTSTWTHCVRLCLSNPILFICTNKWVNWAGMSFSLFLLSCINILKILIYAFVYGILCIMIRNGNDMLRKLVDEQIHKFGVYQRNWNLWPCFYIIIYFTENTYTWHDTTHRHTTTTLMNIHIILYTWYFVCVCVGVYADDKPSCKVKVWCKMREKTVLFFVLTLSFLSELVFFNTGTFFPPPSPEFNFPWLSFRRGGGSHFLTNKKEINTQACNIKVKSK